MFELDVDKVTFIIAKAREFEAQEDLGDAEDMDRLHTEELDDLLESDKPASLIDEDKEDDTVDEIKAWIRSINHDDQCQIVALAWVGRGDFAVGEWDEALKIARDEHNDRTAEYLLGMPLLPDYLEDGLSQFGLLED